MKIHVGAKKCVEWGFEYGESEFFRYIFQQRRVDLGFFQKLGPLGRLLGSFVLIDSTVLFQTQPQNSTDKSATSKQD